MAHRTTVFVSYCHKNKRWLQRLKVHLTPYERRGMLTLWDDTMIDPGDQWRSAISQAIDRAAASIVLLSADFLASEFVATEELPRLLWRAQREGARILPIIVEPCELTAHEELAKLQSLNPPHRPLAELSRVAADRILVDAVGRIGKILTATSLRPQGKPDVPEPTPKAGGLFEELQAASMSLALLCALGSGKADFSLSELERMLDIRSRKRAYEALNRLCGEGWVEKKRRESLTRYEVTDEGARQLQRLAAGADGPIRRAIAFR